MDDTIPVIDLNAGRARAGVAPGIGGAIAWPEWNAGLRIDADPPLGFLVVYSPRGEDFFCAEPVSHCTDAFNLARQGRRDTGMLTLEPGANLSATVRFRPRLE